LDLFTKYKTPRNESNLRVRNRSEASTKLKPSKNPNTSRSTLNDSKYQNDKDKETQ